MPRVPGSEAASERRSRGRAAHAPAGSSSRLLPLLGAKITLPATRSRVDVERAAVIRKLMSATDRSLVSVVAPPGYGKTTALAQWAAHDPRPFAWVGVDEGDRDPVLLLRYLVASLEAARGPSPDGRPLRASVPALVARAAALLERGGGTVLVLDDVHALGQPALDAVELVAHVVPRGSQLVLSGRSECTAIVARRRVAEETCEVTVDDLRLDDGEVTALLQLLDVDVDVANVDPAVLRRETEGWAAGLRFAALALRSGTVASPGAVDSTVEDYLRVEALGELPDEQLAFLRRSAALERMSAELCDAVLERSDSGLMLEAVEAANLFLVPLDHERRWFRYHDVFGTVLRRDLERVSPGSTDNLRRRAAAWCEEHGLLEDAIDYALATNDLERVARLVIVLGFPLYREGRVATVEQWLSVFDDGALLERFPEVAAAGALIHALRGRPFHAERGLDAALRGLELERSPEARERQRGWTEVVETMLCRHGGLAEMQEAASSAQARLGPYHPLRPVAMMHHALGSVFRGDAESGEAELHDVLAVAEALDATLVHVAAAAQLALLAIARGAIDEGKELVRQGERVVRAELHSDYIAVALLQVARARLASHAGDVAGARRALAAAQRLRPQMTHAYPLVSVGCLLDMCRAYAEIDESNAIGALLLQASEILRHRPGLVELAEQVGAARSGAVAASDGRGWESTLTAAELRLLPYLTTHLTFREIGERLFLSRNTVKTQAISIYRKLGASSRNEAVQRAVALGLVEGHVPGSLTPTG